MAKPTNTEFAVEDTLSPRWAYPGDREYETISFIRTEDFSKTPKNVVEPLLTFKFFKRHVKHKREDYSLARRALHFLGFYGIILGMVAGMGLLATPFKDNLTLNQETVLGFLQFAGIFAGALAVILLLFKNMEKYVEDFEKNASFNNSYKAISIFSEEETHYPRWHDSTQGLTSPSHSFYAGKNDHVGIGDEKLYQTVKAYVLSALEAKNRGEEDTESKELYASLADYAIRKKNLWNSKHMIENHSTLKEEMSEEHESVKEHLMVERDSLLVKFKESRDYYDNLSEDRLKADAQNVLYAL